MTRSTTGPEFVLFYFSIFSRYIYYHNWLLYQETPLKPLTHGLRNLYFWHIGLQCDSSHSNPCFLNSYRRISQKLRTIDSQSSLSINNGGKYQIFRIFPPINCTISQKLKPTQIFRTGHQHYSKFLK